MASLVCLSDISLLFCTGFKNRERSYIYLFRIGHAKCHKSDQLKETQAMCDLCYSWLDQYTGHSPRCLDTIILTMLLLLPFCLEGVSSSVGTGE